MKKYGLKIYNYVDIITEQDKVIFPILLYVTMIISYVAVIICFGWKSSLVWLLIGLLSILFVCYMASEMNFKKFIKTIKDFIMSPDMVDYIILFLTSCGGGILLFIILLLVWGAWAHNEDEKEKDTHYRRKKIIKHIIK